METRIFTDKERRALAGLLPFSPKAYVAFTPKEFEAVSESLRPKYFLSAFSNDDLAKIRSAFIAEKFDSNFIREILQGQALANGWENHLDLGTGEVLQYSKEEVSRLPDRLATILYMEASRISGLTSEEKEGLESSPPSTSEPLSEAAQDAGVAQN